MNTNIVETVNVVREVSWLPWAVQYFFLIGLSYGAFLLSLPGVVLHRPGWQTIGRLAALGALVCGLTAPVALLSDLHQPARFLNFYLHFTPSSWMSWGAFFIPVYLGGLVLYVWLALRPSLQKIADEDPHGPWARVAGRLACGGHDSHGPLLAAAMLTTLGAALVALYTGVEVMVVHARPLWHTPLLPVQFFATALAGAIGLTLLLDRFAPGDRDPMRTRRLARSLALTQLIVLLIGAAWLLLALSGASPIHSQALAEVAPYWAWRFTAAWAVGATVLTGWLAWSRPGSGLVIGVLALHSAWMLRWTVFIGGQEIPKTGAGLYAYALPLGQDGLLGIVGTAGLWVALFIALTTLIPVQRLRSAS